MTNWIADENRFLLPQPPEWFLTLMADMDPWLVIIPSRLQKHYILARRRQLTMRVPLLTARHNDLLRRTRGSDGDMLADRQLLYVDKIVAKPGASIRGTWSLGILDDLKDRDILKSGGGDKYADRLDAEDDAARQKRRDLRADEMDHRTNDGWRSYQARTGQRTRLTETPAARKSSSGSTAGSGSGIVITG